MEPDTAQAQDLTQGVNQLDGSYRRIQRPNTPPVVERNADGTWRSVGNPQGRPFKGTSISEHLRSMLSEQRIVSGAQTGESHAQAIARTAIEQAEAGDRSWADLILDRTEGKVTIPVANVTPVTLLLDAADDVP